MIDPSRLSWEETSPGLWRRGLDEVEFYWAKAGKLYDSEGRRPFEITGHVSLAIETTGASADEAAGAYVVQRDLVLRAGHDTIDGAGTLLFFGNLLRFTSEALEAGPDYVVPPLDGTETANLSPPYRVAAGIPATPTPEIQRRIDAMMANHVHFGPAAGSGDLPSLPLPFIKGSPVPGKNQRVEVVLDKTTVTKVLAACKAVGVTITHVLNAAIPLAIRDLVEPQSQETKYNYVHDLLYNLRGFCQPPYNTAAHAVSAYHSGSAKGNRVPITVPAAGAPPPSPEARKDEFAAVLARVRDYYVFVKNDADQGQLSPYCWAGHLGGMPPIPVSPPPGPPPGETASVTVSSLGRVDGIIPPRIGALRVSSPWVMGEEMSNSLGFFMVTHDGSLSLAAAYNDAWHEREEVRAFITRCVALALEFLGVDAEGAAR